MGYTKYTELNLILNSFFSVGAEAEEKWLFAGQGAIRTRPNLFFCCYFNTFQVDDVFLDSCYD